MNVSQASSDCRHLIVWVNAECGYLGHTIPVYRIKDMFEFGLIYKILNNVDSQCFGLLSHRIDAIEDILISLEEFLNKQCGKRIRLPLKKKILFDFELAQLIGLILYGCLHSSKKQEYIFRIMKLEQEIQGALMKTIQGISQYLESTREIKQILMRVEQLEMEAESMKKQLGLSNLNSEIQSQVILDLEDDLSKSMQELKTFKLEKERVIQALKVSNLEEYLTCFQKVQKQNEILNDYVHELQDANSEYQAGEKQLKKCIKEQMIVINELNDEIVHIKQKYNVLKNESLCEETLDTTRSFGIELNSQSKQNLDISHIDRSYRSSLKGPRFSLHSDWEQQNKENVISEEVLMTEMEQLRKYNTEIMSKLENSYKTIQKMSEEISTFKESNKDLKKENKFYKKQLHELRKLNECFAKKYLGYD